MLSIETEIGTIYLVAEEGGRIKKFMISKEASLR
jgi:hypothetical protein